MPDSKGHYTPEELHQIMKDCIQRWQNMIDGKLFKEQLSPAMKKRCERRIRKTKMDIEWCIKRGIFKPDREG